MFNWFKRKKKTNYGYFKPDETKCKCGCGFDITDELRDVLNKVRQDFGSPMIINSGARCELYNELIGGSPNSAHVMGKAVDVRAVGERYREFLDEIRKKHNLRRGRYKRFFHLDLLIDERNDFEGGY